MTDVHVWGDSHWRNFFPFVNHGPPGATHEQDGIRTIDMVANELAGATMYGLLNPNSKNGARKRILSDLDRIGPIENVGLVFSEVDGRYPQHHDRYFVNDKISLGKIYEAVSRYRRFIDEDLLFPKRVTGHVFVYHGFTYPKGEQTLLQPGMPIGRPGIDRAELVNEYIRMAIKDMMYGPIVPIILHPKYSEVSSDGVHLVPELIYPQVLRVMVDRLNPAAKEIPF